MTRLTCFKAYDVRGKLGEELNEEVAYRIGRAFAQYLNAKCVVVGADVRTSSEQLKSALIKGLLDSGTDVIDLGQTGTEEIYFAAFSLDVDGGIEITASHNPIDYNGMKFVGRGALPISGDSGLQTIQELAEQQSSAPDNTSFEENTCSSANQNSSKLHCNILNAKKPRVHRGTLTQTSLLERFVDHLLGYIDLSKLKPLKLVANSGNGTAGHIIDEIEMRFKKLQTPITFVKIQHEPDGSFPNGIPNPLLPENRTVTSQAVQQYQADVGIAWDGDFDRCFFFDEQGSFIEGYYLVGLIAEAFLKKYPGEKVIHDPRLTWNSIDIVKNSAGVPIQSKTGHAFIKESMRRENAIYGGEMSAHHYFRDFAYCDSGMIPWLLVAELISQSGKSLSQLVGERIEKFPCSGEINFKVSEPMKMLSMIQAHYQNVTDLVSVEHIDGLSMAFKDWRFNLRCSNTEPLLRLNVETCQDKILLNHKLDELKNMIQSGATL